MMQPMIGLGVTLVFAAFVPSAPDDDLDRALRVVTAPEKLEEGVDFEYTQEGLQLIYDAICYTQSSLRCSNQSMPCKYLSVGAACVYCDGAGGSFFATHGFCVPHPSDTCLVNPAGQTKCGKQKRSTCAGVAPNLTCATVMPTSNKDCHFKECTGG